MYGHHYESSSQPSPITEALTKLLVATTTINTRVGVRPFFQILHPRNQCARSAFTLSGCLTCGYEIYHHHHHRHHHHQLPSSPLSSSSSSWSRSLLLQRCFTLRCTRIAVVAHITILRSLAGRSTYILLSPHYEARKEASVKGGQGQREQCLLFKEVLRTERIVEGKPWCFPRCGTVFPDY